MLSYQDTPLVKLYRCSNCNELLVMRLITPLLFMFDILPDTCVIPKLSFEASRRNVMGELTYQQQASSLIVQRLQLPGTVRFP
jgi:hypothetical protein